MKNKILKIFMVCVVLLAGWAVWRMMGARNGASQAGTRLITPAMGRLKAVISTTGTVLPKNRLEIKPPVNGRIESIQVKEGEQVKVGTILAWMSSTERAALLDNARGQGEEAVRYWEQAYKPIPLSAPIEGEVIVATTQPGQTVTTADAVVVLSDHLIIRAQVDETDIGKIKKGQKARIVLDAYPEEKINAEVEHIYHESETVNNVTIYKVDLKPREIPVFFRSGMNATVDFVLESGSDTLLVPQEALFTEMGQTYIWVSESKRKEPQKRAVKTGLSDDENVAILDGLGSDEQVVIKIKGYVSGQAGTGGSNPFMPSRRR